MQEQQMAVIFFTISSNLSVKFYKQFG